MVKNAPHDDLPPNSVAGLVNAHCYPTEVQPRLASWLYSELQPPAWQDDCEDAKSNLTASKDGNIVTLIGDTFDLDDISCYFAWPTDDGYQHDEIQEYLTANTVRVDRSGTIAATDGCYIHGRHNLNVFHRKVRKKINQWGRRVYTTEIAMSSWDECLCVSRKMPSNVISDSAPMDEYLMIGNSRGIFKLSFDAAQPMLWRANSPVPDVLLEGRARRKEYKYRYDYLHSMARLDGAGIRSTLTGAKIQQRSGTTALNTDVIPNRDYGTYWTEKPVGSGVNTGGRLRTGVLAAANRVPSYWAGIAAPGVTFNFTHNERSEDFLCDMSDTGYDVKSMDDVANALQDTIRTLFSWIEVEWFEEGYMEFRTGREADATLDYLQDGTGGTNIAAILLGREADGATLDNTWNYNAPNQVGILYNPTDDDIPEWHWNHYTLWRTTDISENGADPRTTEDGEELQPLKFTYAGDYRIAGAFYASRTGNIVTAEVGTFEKADEGTPLKWEDGDIDTISEYISDTKVSVSIRGYSDGAKVLQACAIGGGRVLRASQDGDIVTLETELNGDYFSADGCDVRKTIYFSNGYEAIIKEVLDGNHVRVHDSTFRDTQGITIDPTCRVITDTYTDETLRQLMDETHAGLLNARFREPMPNGNILEIVPGFMLTAQRTNDLVHYCDLPSKMKYSAGYHLPNRQTLDKVSGSIQLIKKAPNYFIIWCNDSTWAAPTNNPDIKKLPEFGEWYGVLHADVVDEEIGVVDYGGIQEIAPGAFQMLCADNSWRQFINRRYSDDLMVDQNTGQDRIKKDFAGTWNLGTGLYGKKLGHIWWGTSRTFTETEIFL